MKKIAFIIIGILCLTPVINAPIALLLGMLFSLILDNPFKKHSIIYSKKFLQWSIIGLGFGLNIHAALQVSKDGIWLTIGTILLVFILGYLLNYIFKLSKNTATLISSGTAICGGSAIAAIAPIIRAKSNEISIAIGAVFILNAIALFLFPVIGHAFELSQYQFGLWSAIAIHDTSSVVGASQAYGEEALKMATTVKLSRALWIIPISLLFSLFNKGKSKISIPYFIIGFIITMLLSSFLPSGKPFYDIMSTISKHLLVLTLFLIGANIQLTDIKKAGWQSITFASIIWIVVSIISFWVIYQFY